MGFILIAAQAFGAAATFTRVEGKVQVMAGKKARKAGVGDEVAAGETVKTMPASKALLVTPEGDQIMLAEKTTMEIKGDSTPKSTSLGLLRGKLRSVFSKGDGSRTMKVRSTSAAMGVRGTDFTVEDEENQPNELTVVRGEVEMQPDGTPTPQPVKSGETAQATKGVPPKIAQATQEKLGKISALSKIAKPDAGSVPAGKLSAAQGLEGKAADNATGDIKKYVPGFDPAKFGVKPGNLDGINDVAMKLTSQMKLPGGGGMPSMPAAPKAPAVPAAPKVPDAGKNIFKKFGK